MGHHDFLQLRLGVGAWPWAPPLPSSTAPRHAEIARAIDGASPIADTPIDVGLAKHGVVGIVGPRDAALALARGLAIQAAVHHGPADLAITVVGGQQWAWTEWLPHTADLDGGPRRVTDQPTEIDGIAHGLLGQDDTLRTITLFIVDGVRLLQGRRSTLRAVHRHAGQWHRDR